MKCSIGSRLYDARVSRGWDQAEVAARLGAEVTQQTVSRWEKGRSRPRREMVVKVAALFDLDTAELLEAAGYSRLGDRPHGVARPVRPRLTTLPVWDLSPAMFEELVADIAQHLYPAAVASRFGGQGHKQHGVDVVVTEGSRYLATYQCKRRDRFGPDLVARAVAEVDVEAETHFLALSRRNASPQARGEIRKHPGWTLWDAEDISRIVRNLPGDRAIRIVDSYFPGWRQQLLGVAEPGPWLTSEEFFRSRATGSIYGHEWTLVGRSAELNGISKFVDGAGPKVGILIGRGGIGKTRLLREVATRAEAQGTSVRFAKSGMDIKSEQVEQLETDVHLLVVLDDVHDRDGGVAVLGDLLDRSPHIRVLMAMRPYGLSALAGDLQQLGIRAEDLPRWTLEELSRDEAAALAREALGPDWPDALAERLGYLTADCPFITVIAGVLIRRGDLSPACVDHEDDIRQEVLRRFRDIVVADPLSETPAGRRAVLDGLAVLQPFRSDQASFQDTLARLTDMPYDRAVGHIRALDDAGVLMRRGASVRIIPDLLGDVALTEACFDDRARASTHYLERAWRAAEGETVRNIFVNAARVDWAVRHDHSGVASLATGLWDDVADALKSAGVRGRIGLVQLLEKVAYFEPRHSLALVRWLIDNPTDWLEDDDSWQARLFTPTYRDVLGELPALLRLIAHHLEFLPSAADLLWEMAAPDDRPTNQHPAHPLRVLRALAEFGVDKPSAFNIALVDAAERWFGREYPSSRMSPFDVLEPLLATEGATDSMHGYELRFRTFSVPPDAVRPIRQRAVSLALRELHSDDIGRATRAASFLGASLRYPMGLFGHRASDAEQAAWTPDFVQILHDVAEVVSGGNIDPLVVVMLRQAVQWHAEHSPTVTREIAQQVRRGLPASLEDRVALALFDGWGQLAEDRSRDFATAEASREAQIATLAAELVDSRSDTEVTDLLVRRLELQRGAVGLRDGNPGPFVAAVVEARPEVGRDLCGRAGAEPDSVVVSVLAVVVAVLADAVGDQTIAFVRQLLGTRALAIRRAVGQGLGWNRGRRDMLLDGEEDVLIQLAEDPDIVVRQMILRAAQRLASVHPSLAVELACRVPFIDSEEVADDLFQLFAGSAELKWNQLSQSDADRLLGQLVECPSLTSYWVTGFLSELSKDEPERVVALLVARVEHWEGLEAPVGGFEPLPYIWHHPLQVRSHADFVRLLRRIRDWVASEPGSWRRQHEGGQLFQAVSTVFDQGVVAVLDEAIESGDPSQMVAVASLLRYAPRNAVFEEIDLVHRALNAAASHGDEIVQQVAGALHAAVVNGGRSGRPGEPFPEDVDQRARSRSIADSLPKGSLEEKFYRSLEMSAEEAIRWQVDRDERYFDKRDW